MEALVSLVCLGILGMAGPAILAFLLVNRVLTRFITNPTVLGWTRAVFICASIALVPAAVALINQSMWFMLLLVPLGIWGAAWLFGLLGEALIKSIINAIKNGNSSQQAAEAAPVVAQHLRNGDYRSARFPSDRRH